MSTATVVPLFERHPNMPYCGMAVLHAISMRRFHPDVPFVICDYSQSADVDEILSYWGSSLCVEVNKLSIPKSPTKFTLYDALSLKLDTILQLAEVGQYQTLICVEADMLATGPVLWLTEGEFHLKLVDRSHTVPEGAAVSNSLLVINMKSTKALRIIALARSLHQERYVWRHLKELTVSQASGHSERLMEVAVRLLRRDGIGHITWREYDACYVHYARYNKVQYPNILPWARTVLDESKHKSRFLADFGSLEPLIFRETSGGWAPAHG